MCSRRIMSAMLVALITAIGCGGGQPQDASATTDDATAAQERNAPMQLAQAPPVAPQAAAGTGASVQGVVTFDGTPPKPKQINSKMAADPTCQAQHTDPVYSEEIVVNDGGTLRNVFVYVTEGVSGSYPTPSEPVVLDQHGCQYTPHVAGIQVNQPLQIVNSDATLHNINAKPTTNRKFNIAQPVQGMKTVKKFTKPEIMVPFKCNVHSWMNAYIGVVAHPFFSVSGEDGSFAISGLPDGSYVVEAWHETLGTQTQSVEVAGGQAPAVTFSFSTQ